MERGGGALNNNTVHVYAIKAYTCAQMKDKSPVSSHTKHTAHRSLPLCIHCYQPRISKVGRHMPMYGCNYF